MERMKLVVSPKIQTKLANKKPPVTVGEILECFATRERSFLTDTRENNQTMPPTLWFISDTFMGRWLKVVFIQAPDGAIIIKTAYDPNATERWLYSTHSKPEM
jgi:hypothetical protein